jgi:hypothetical protein
LCSPLAKVRGLISAMFASIEGVAECDASLCINEKLHVDSTYIASPPTKKIYMYELIDFVYIYIFFGGVIP